MAESSRSAQRAADGHILVLDAKRIHLGNDAQRCPHDPRDNVADPNCANPLVQPVVVRVAGPVRRNIVRNPAGKLNNVAIVADRIVGSVRVGLGPPDDLEPRGVHSLAQPGVAGRVDGPDGAGPVCVRGVVHVGGGGRAAGM